MAIVNHSDDHRSSPDLCISLGAAVAGLIPGFSYLALFFCGVFGLVDWVGLLADRLTVWFAPISISGLMFTMMVGASSGSTGRYQSGIRACVVVSVLLVVLDVPLMLIQLVSLFEYFD